MKMTKFKIAGLITFISLILSGCGYRVGSLLPSDLSTVTIPTFINKTSEPNIEIDVTNGVIEEFQKDGTLKVVAEDKADTILTGEIISYEKVAQLYDSQGTVQESKLIVWTDILFKRLATDEIIVKARVKGEAKFNIGESQFESEREILPEAVKDLSQHIVEKVVEGGW